MWRTNFRKVALLLAAGAMWMGMASGARGDIVLNTTGPDGGNINNAVWISGSSNPTDAAIATALNATTTPPGTFTAATLPTLLYKQDFGGAESGSLAGSYQAVYDVNNTSGNLVITHTGGAYVGTALPTWLLVKDGNMGSYLWNLTGLWDGQEQITVQPLFPHNGSFKAFSHVEIGGTPVAEPTTMIAGALLLLPFAASTLRFLRRIHAA